MNIYNGSIYLAFKCSNYYISVYSTTTSLFEYYYINDISITLNAIVRDTSRIYLGGIYLKAYFTSSLVSSITANQKISPSPITMDLYSTGQSESVTSTSKTIKIISNPSITDASSINFDTTSTISNTKSPTDIQYYVSSVSFTGLSSSTFYSKSNSLTCSTAGTNSITYSLVSYNGQTLPSWVTLDSSNQLLNFTTPTVSITTTYQFAVQATISGSNYLTPVTLSVNAATSNSKYNTESNWANGYITSFFATITINGLIVTLIQLIVFIFELRKLTCCKRKTVAIKVTPEASINDQIEIPRVEVRPETNMNLKEGSINSKKEEVKESSFDRFYAYRSSKDFR